LKDRGTSTRLVKPVELILKILKHSGLQVTESGWEMQLEFFFNELGV
jgi:hypothetical protein